MVRHIELTCEWIAQQNWHTRFREYVNSFPRFKRPWNLLALTLGLGFTTQYGEYLRDSAGDILSGSSRQISRSPLISDLSILLNYPQYTQKKMVRLESSDGNIFALRGTMVELKATTMVPMANAQIEVQPEGQVEKNIIKLTVHKRRNLSGRFQVKTAGTYRFVINKLDGTIIEDSTRYNIRLEEDRPPQIKMTFPTSDVELRDPKGLWIEWKTSDDFGLSNVFFQLQNPNKPLRTVPLTSGRTRKELNGRYHFNPIEYELTAGQSVSIYIEALDNDRVSGPKSAQTMHRQITIFDPNKTKDEIHQTQRQLVTQIVELLADELVSHSTLSQDEIRQILNQQEQILKKLKGLDENISLLLENVELIDSELTQTLQAFFNAQKNLKRIENARKKVLKNYHINQGRGLENLVRDQQIFSISKLETNLIYLEDLLNTERVARLKEQATSMLQRQNDMRALLESFTNSKDPRTKELLEKRMDEIQESIVELFKRMGELQKSLPTEYRNREAMKLNEMANHFKDFQKALQEGRFEDAKQHLEEIEKSLESMVEAVIKMHEEPTSERYTALNQALDTLGRDLNDIKTKQQNISENTKKLLQEYRKTALEKSGGSEKGLKEKLMHLIEEVLRKVEKSSAIPGMNQTLLEQLFKLRQYTVDIRLLVESTNYSDALELAQNAKGIFPQILRHIQKIPASRDQKLFGKVIKKANEKLKEFIQLLEELFAPPSKLLPPKTNERIGQSADHQKSLGIDLQKLRQALRQIDQEAPIMNDEQRRNLEQAQRAMNQANMFLEQKNLAKANRQQRQALEHLQNLQQKLSQTPGQGMPMPFAMNNPSFGRQPSGFNPSEKTDVEIPKAIQEQETAAFRKALMEAAKQKAPKDYEDSVREYYRDLVE
ncbi:MAG: DUF4175 family protein [Myxococcota bacterium]|nr:DUF4175 family protein [Myxococcota bacterium]